jgi:hypothetical protein
MDHGSIDRWKVWLVATRPGGVLPRLQLSSTQPIESDEVFDDAGLGDVDFGSRTLGAFGTHSLDSMSPSNLSTVAKASTGWRLRRVTW